MAKDSLATRLLAQRAVQAGEEIDSRNQEDRLPELSGLESLGGSLWAAGHAAVVISAGMSMSLAFGLLAAGSPIVFVVMVFGVATAGAIACSKATAHRGAMLVGGFSAFVIEARWLQQVVSNALA